MSVLLAIESNATPRNGLQYSTFTASQYNLLLRKFTLLSATFLFVCVWPHFTTVRSSSHTMLTNNNNKKSLYNKLMMMMMMMIGTVIVLPSIVDRFFQSATHLQTGKFKNKHPPYIHIARIAIDPVEPIEQEPATDSTTTNSMWSQWITFNLILHLIGSNGPQHSTNATPRYLTGPSVCVNQLPGHEHMCSIVCSCLQLLVVAFGCCCCLLLIYHHADDLAQCRSRRVENSGNDFVSFGHFLKFGGVWVQIDLCVPQTDTIHYSTCNSTICNSVLVGTIMQSFYFLLLSFTHSHSQSH